MKSRSVDCATQSAGKVSNQMSSQIPRAAVARVAVKAVKAVTAPTSAIAVDKSDIEDLIVLIEMKVAVAVESEDS